MSGHLRQVLLYFSYRCMLFKIFKLKDKCVLPLKDYQGKIKGWVMITCASNELRIKIIPKAAPSTVPAMSPNSFPARTSSLT